MTWKELKEAVESESLRLGVSIDDIEVTYDDEYWGRYRVVTRAVTSLYRNDAPGDRLAVPNIRLS